MAMQRGAHKASLCIQVRMDAVLLLSNKKCGLNGHSLVEPGSNHEYMANIIRFEHLSMPVLAFCDCIL